MRLGLLQCAAGGLDRAGRLALVEAALAGAGLDLLVLPELFLSGYHAGREAIAAAAEPRDGPGAAAMAGLARRHGTALVWGYAERAGDALHNAAAAVGADGAPLAHHRKRLPSPGSFEEALFAPGDGSAPFAVAGLTCALAICYEIEFPETARAAARAGAGLLLAPTALVDRWPVVAERVIPARAFENGIWLAYANHAGTEGGARYLGGSRIVAPDGREAAVAGAAPALLAATIDPAAVAAAQARLPYLRDAPRLRF